MYLRSVPQLLLCHFVVQLRHTSHFLSRLLKIPNQIQGIFVTSSLKKTSDQHTFFTFRTYIFKPLSYYKTRQQKWHKAAAKPVESNFKKSNHLRNTKQKIKSEIVVVFVDQSHVFDRLIEFHTEKNIVDLVRRSPFDFSDTCCCYCHKNNEQLFRQRLQQK